MKEFYELWVEPTPTYYENNVIEKISNYLRSIDIDNYDIDKKEHLYFIKFISDTTQVELLKKYIAKITDFRQEKYDGNGTLTNHGRIEKISELNEFQSSINDTWETLFNVYKKESEKKEEKVNEDWEEFFKSFNEEVEEKKEEPKKIKRIKQ